MTLPLGRKQLNSTLASGESETSSSTTRPSLGSSAGTRLTAPSASQPPTRPPIVVYIRRGQPRKARASQLAQEPQVYPGMRGAKYASTGTVGNVPTLAAPWPEHTYAPTVAVREPTSPQHAPIGEHPLANTPNTPPSHHAPSPRTEAHQVTHSHSMPKIPFVQHWNTHRSPHPHIPQSPYWYPPHTPGNVEHPHTPVNVERLRTLLITHPDTAFVDYLVHGFTHGFSIGYRGPREHRFSHNLPSARHRPTVIGDYIAAECSAGNTVGPFTMPQVPQLVVNPLGAVPKKSGKWRLIMHLSFPERGSVNDGIAIKEFPLKYITVYDAMDAIMRLGRGAQMAKIDIKSAFRLCPVRPEDQPLLGMHWENHYYYDRVLPFGLRSAPYIFNCLAEAVEWIAKEQGAETVLHYLDDFFVAGSASSSECQDSLNTIMAVCEELQIPLAEKQEGPATVITFLGILLDSENLEARLPPGKLQEIKQALSHWSRRQSCTKQQLLSLIGTLSFAAKVVPPGRTFLRRMIDLSTTVRGLSQHIVLDTNFKRDLAWWSEYLTSWNGASFFLQPQWSLAPDLTLYTDSSGTIGFGAYFQGSWFQGHWDEEDAPKSIQYKELYPIVLAAHTWGAQWRRKKVLFLCDNQAVVACLRSGTAKCPHIMSLLRALFLICARGSFTVSARHVPGIENGIADALSRFNMQAFRCLAPQAHQHPTPIPQRLPSANI